MAKENSLNRKEIIKGSHLGMLGMKKEHGKLKIWVIQQAFLLLLSFQNYIWWFSQNYNIVWYYSKCMQKEYIRQL